MKPAQAPSRQQRIAAVYDSDIWPLLPARAAGMILRALPRRPGSVVLEVGCATGRLTLALAEQLDTASRILAIDGSQAFIDVAETEKARRAAGVKVSFHVADLEPPLLVDSAGYDFVVSNLAFADTADPAALVADLARCLKPGGRAILTLPLRGSWDEFLDIYGDVLTEQGKPHARAALAAHRAAQPDGESAARWLDAAGLDNVTVEVTRFELLFKSAREFFFSPVVDFGPLPSWKQIAGKRGDEMQDMFFFVKEAIETYFAGGVFPATLVIGCLQGTKPTSDGAA
jgi:SAM-dependent methyltransferase